MIKKAKQFPNTIKKMIDTDNKRSMRIAKLKMKILFIFGGDNE